MGQPHGAEVETMYLVSIGEVMLRLSPPRYQRLRRASALDVYVCGSQLNVAADLARLGKRTAFVTKLPSNELGLLALDVCRSYGVDMSYVQLVAGGRMGVNYVEFSAAPRREVAVYDRAGSAASTIAPGDFDWRRILAGVRFAYTDGIFPGLAANCAAAAAEFVTVAHEARCTVCFDMNARRHLWTPERARDVWTRILPHVDILVTNRGVSSTVLGYEGTDVQMARRYLDAFGCQVVCMTARKTPSLAHGVWNSMAVTHSAVYESQPIEFDIVDSFGTGDAWFAGFLYGYDAGDIGYALGFGNALCALAHTIEGDVVHVSSSHVQALLEGESELRAER